MQLQEIKVELTTNCTCSFYNDEEELEQPDYCFGDCSDWAVEGVNEMADLFLQANEVSQYDYLLIEGTGMGWTRASGYKLIKANVDAIREGLMLNGDFTLEFYLTEDHKTLTARRWSHDEPMGTGLFTFKKVDVCDYSGCESMDNLQKYKDGKYCEFCYEIAELNW